MTKNKELVTAAHLYVSPLSLHVTEGIALIYFLVCSAVCNAVTDELQLGSFIGNFLKTHLYYVFRADAHILASYLLLYA